MATLIKKECNVIMFGTTGMGKSSFGNSLLCQPDTKPFQSKSSASSITVKCKRKRSLLSDGTLLTVIDTPGLFDTSTPNKDIITEICKCVSLCAPGPDIIAVVLNLKRFTKEMMDTIDILKKLFGEEVMKRVIIVFTGKDQLDDTFDDDGIRTVAELVQLGPPFLEQLVLECNNRYVGIANSPRSPTHENDVRDVMKLIYKTMDENKNQGYSLEIFIKAERIIQRLIEEKMTEKPIHGQIGNEMKWSFTSYCSAPDWANEDGGQIGESEKDTTEHEREVREEIKRGIESNNEGYLPILWNGISSSKSYAFGEQDICFAAEFRVVIVGKTGVGKSSLGNSLIGKDIFKTSKSLSSKTQICKIDEAQTSIGRLKVVDTPGLFDTAIPNGEKIEELVKCVVQLAPGPHVFIFVLKAETTTQNDEETIQILRKTFGEDIMRHVIVVFTKKDQLTETKPEEFIQDLPKFLEQLLNDVKDRRQFICNRQENSSHAQDVENVLTLIKNTVEQNGGTYYTPEMFQAIEIAMQKEIKEKQKREKKSAEECRQEIETDIVNNKQRTVDKIIDSVTTMVTTATPFLCQILFHYVKMKMQQKK